MLMPEGVLVLTGSAAEVIALCDGTRDQNAIVSELARRHPGAPVERDVAVLLDKLRARGLLEG